MRGTEFSLGTVQQSTLVGDVKGKLSLRVRSTSVRHPHLYSVLANRKP
jgi:hypothetical protein